jgi:hypothetical protein
MDVCVCLFDLQQGPALLFRERNSPVSELRASLLDSSHRWDAYDWISKHGELRWRPTLAFSMTAESF